MFFKTPRPNRPCPAPRRGRRTQMPCGEPAGACPPRPLPRGGAERTGWAAPALWRGTGWRPSGAFSGHHRPPCPTWSPWLRHAAPEPSLGLMASRPSRRDSAAEVTRGPVSGAPVGPVGGSLWTLSSSCVRPFHGLPESRERRQEPSLGSVRRGVRRTAGRGPGPGSGPRRRLLVKGSFSCDFLL